MGLEQRSLDPPGTDVVVLPFYDWKKCEAVGFRTRDAHIVQELLKSPFVRRLLVVGRPTTIPEMIATRRWWRVRGGTPVTRTATTALTQVHPKGFTLDVLHLSLLRPLWLRLSWWDYALRHPRTQSAIKKAVHVLGMHKPVVIACTPLSAGALPALDSSAILFSADDDWLHHPGMTRSLDRGRIAAGYDVLCQIADRVIVNSKALATTLSARRPDLVHVPNGVSPELFSGPLGRPPQDLSRLPRPWIGYAGTLAPRIDVPLLLEVARALPSASFVLLGPIDNRAWIAPLRREPNIHWLGNKHYDELPDYIRRFDVAIIPHNVGALENRGDPIKLYEYLSAGRPVVTTPIGDIEDSTPHITVASTADEFVLAISAYLALSPSARDEYASSLRAAVPPQRTWHHAAQCFIDVIRDAQRHRMSSQQ